jgi:PAS domain S-box-containing protein
MKTKKSLTNKSYNSMKQSTSTLRSRQEFVKLMESISIRFISCHLDTLDTEITFALEKIGSIVNADRSYVFLFDESGKTMSNTHEWCATGVEPQKNNLQSLPMDMFPWWISQLKAKQDIQFSRIADLPPEAGTERQILEMQSIRSVIVVPIEVHERLIGFVGLDAVQQEVHWTPEVAVLLRIVSCAIANSLEIKRAQYNLIEREDNFKLLIESISDIIVVTDNSQRFLFFNQALSKKLGYSKQEVANMHLLDLHSQQDQQAAEDIFGAMLRGERDYCTLPLATKSGKLIPAETRVWFGKWDGKDCIYGICKDLTAEHEALQLFERLFQQTPLPIALTSLEDGKFIKVNDAFLILFGYSLNEIIGKTSDELGLFVKPESQAEAAKQLIASGSVSDFEMQIRKVDGSILDGLFSGTIIKNQRQKYFLTVMRDITEMNRLRQKALEREVELKEAQSMAKIGRWDYHHGRNYLAWSDTIYDIFEISKNEFGASYEAFLETIHPGDRNMFIQTWQSSLKDHTPYMFEHRLLMKDGRIKWVNEECQTEYDQKGQPVHSVGIVQDITERKNIADDLAETSRRIETLNVSLQERIIEVQAANKAKSDFLSNVSHELRTPLTAIIGVSELLQKQYYGTLNKKQVEYVGDILDSSQHLLSLINEILDLTKIEAGRVTLELTKANVTKLIKESLLIVRESAFLNNITIKMAVKKEFANLTIRVDQKRFKQIMVNLLTNAIKFSPSGSTVGVEVDELKGNIVFIVSDTGIGIAPEYQEKIFDIFYQVQNGVVNKPAGVGLGLSITKHLVELHGGKLWVESEGEGKGSRFMFTIPLISQSPETDGDGDVI